MYKRGFGKTVLFLLITSVFLFGLTSCTLFSAKSGKSAYDIAVENGFVGSESDWLASLRGAPGSDGQSAETESVEDVYAAYINHGGTLSFEDFLYEYFAGYDYGGDENGDAGFAASVALRSVVTVHANFGAVYSAGAGVIFSLDRAVGTAYIVTNYHVVYENRVSSNIKVALYGKEDDLDGLSGNKYEMNASFVGGSAANDVAVLIVANNSQLVNNFFVQAVSVADSDGIYPGDSVIAVGNPGDLGIAVTAGIISQDSDEVVMSAIVGSGSISLRLIRVDAAVNGGNSGGGLFNDKGELLGIVNSKIVGDGEDENIENMSYAIPSNVAIGIAESIAANAGTGKRITFAGLGVSLTASNITLLYDEDAARVEIVHTVSVRTISIQSPLRGKIATGDGLVGITIKDSSNAVRIEKSVTRIYQADDTLLKARQGDTVILTILRGDLAFEVSVTPDSAYYTAIS
jgi:S1-C subfamily serine protease